MKKLTSLQKGLVLHVPLNQESYNSATKRFSDKTPYSNHGTSANAASFDTDRMGNSNQSMTFNGSSDYVNCGDDASLDITDDITISSWINSPSPITNGGICTKQSAGTGFILDVAGSASVNLRLKDGVNSIQSYTTGIDTTRWNLIVGVLSGRNATGLKLYVNGVLKTTSDTTALGSILNAGNAKIGYNDYNTKYFNGSIYDVRIYNHALTSSEIKLLYNSYNPKVII